MLQRLVLKMVGCLGIALRVEVQFPEVLERFRRDDVGPELRTPKGKPKTCWNKLPSASIQPGGC
jgi:hypothetical protein